MKKIILLAGLLASLGSAQAQNLLQNPDFELGNDAVTGFPAFWSASSASGTVMNGALDGSVAHSGSFSFRFDSHSSGPPFFVGAIQNLRTPQTSSSSPFGTPVNSGDTISFSAWVRNNAADPIAAGATGQLVMQFQTAAGVSAGDFFSPTWNLTLDTGGWTQFTTGPVLVPQSARYALFEISNFTAFQNSGSFFIDSLDASVAAIPEPSSLALMVIGGLVLLLSFRSRRLLV